MDNNKMSHKMNVATPFDITQAAFLAQSGDNRDMAHMRGILARFIKHPFLTNGERDAIQQELMAA